MNFINSDGSITEDEKTILYNCLSFFKLITNAGFKIYTFDVILRMEEEAEKNSKTVTSNNEIASSNDEMVF
jgi:hypothetical protein